MKLKRKVSKVYIIYLVFIVTIILLGFVWDYQSEKNYQQKQREFQLNQQLSSENIYINDNIMLKGYSSSTHNITSYSDSMHDVFSPQDLKISKIKINNNINCGIFTNFGPIDSIIIYDKDSLLIYRDKNKDWHMKLYKD